MIAHVVLFRPLEGLDASARSAILEALARARREIPSIRRFRLGQRVRHGLPGYERAMTEPYEFALLIEFDDLDGLRAYLQHPAHADAGRLFITSSAAALAYDYDVADLFEA